MRNNMFCVLTESRILFLSVWIFLLLFKVEGKVWNDVTACYGADDDCSKYQMQCPDGTSIILGKLMYGTKHWQQQVCQYGISNCKKVEDVADCCSYNTSDTFTPFSSTNMSAIFENCEGKSSCEGWAPRLAVTPYSSYVWMQYACVSDKNVIDMCQNETISGNDLFIRFNASSRNLRNKTDTPQDCSCQILTPACDVKMVTTLVDLDFNLPKPDTSSSVCSASSLELVKQNKTFQCQNTELYTKEHTFERMTEIHAHTENEIVSLKNIKVGNETNGPNYVMLYVKTTPQQPILVKCFKPGTKTSLANRQCPTTTSTKTDSTQQVSTESLTSEISTSSSSSSIANQHTTSTSPTTSSSVQFPSTSSLLSSSAPPHSTISPLPTTTSRNLTLFTKTTNSAIDHSLKTKSTGKSDLVSASFSKHVSYISTTPTAIQSSTNHPSTKHSSITHSDTIPQSHQSTSSQRAYTDSISTLFSTVSSSVKFDSSPTNFLPSSYYTGDNSSPISSHTTQMSLTSPSTLTPSLSTVNKSVVGTTDNTEQTTGYNMDTSSINNTDASSITTVKTKDDDNNKNNNGLIIGISVAVVIIVMIIVALVMVCLCLRIKRKEKVRRNYIRNTNIFYSFPEDYNDAGDTLSNSSPETDRREPSFSTIPKSRHYESVGNPSPSSTLNKVASPVYFDQYKIKSLDADDNEVNDKDIRTYSRMPSDSTYVSETSNETIDFVNAIENDDSLPVDSNSNIENGGKTVTFDPSVFYAKVRKEGRTKF